MALVKGNSSTILEQTQKVSRVKHEGTMRSVSTLGKFKRLVPLKVRLIVGEMFGWLLVSDDKDLWQEIWRQNLDTLKKGGGLQPDPGLVGDKEYITRSVLSYYGKFEDIYTLGAGCGTGRIEAWLAGKGAKVICLDHFVEALQVSRIHAQRLHCAEHFLVGDLEQMPFKGETFNLIYSGGVLEHFNKPTDVLREYFRVTKPGGIIIVSVPNLVGVNAGFGMRPVMEPLINKFRKTVNIEQNFSSMKFKKALKESGFRYLDISPAFFNIFDYFPFRYLRKFLSLLRIYAYYCRFLNSFGRRFPGIAFGYSFIIALAQRPKI